MSQRPPSSKETLQGLEGGPEPILDVAPAWGFGLHCGDPVEDELDGGYLEFDGDEPGAAAPRPRCACVCSHPTPAEVNVAMFDNRLSLGDALHAERLPGPLFFSEPAPQQLAAPPNAPTPFHGGNEAFVVYQPAADEELFDGFGSAWYSPEPGVGTPEPEPEPPSQQLYAWGAALAERDHTTAMYLTQLPPAAVRTYKQPPPAKEVPLPTYLPSPAFSDADEPKIETVVFNPVTLQPEVQMLPAPEKPPEELPAHRRFSYAPPPAWSPEAKLEEPPSLGVYRPSPPWQVHGDDDEPNPPPKLPKSLQPDCDLVAFRPPPAWVDEPPEPAEPIAPPDAVPRKYRKAPKYVMGADDPEWQAMLLAEERAALLEEQRLAREEAERLAREEAEKNHWLRLAEAAENPPWLQELVYAMAPKYVNNRIDNDWDRPKKTVAPGPKYRLAPRYQHEEADDWPEEAEVPEPIAGPLPPELLPYIGVPQYGEEEEPEPEPEPPSAATITWRAPPAFESDPEDEFLEPPDVISNESYGGPPDFVDEPGDDSPPPPPPAHTAVEFRKAPRFVVEPEDYPEPPPPPAHIAMSFTPAPAYIVEAEDYPAPPPPPAHLAMPFACAPDYQVEPDDYPAPPPPAPHRAMPFAPAPPYIVEAADYEGVAPEHDVNALMRAAEADRIARNKQRRQDALPPPAVAPEHDANALMAAARRDLAQRQRARAKAKEGEAPAPPQREHNVEALMRAAESELSQRRRAQHAQRADESDDAASPPPPQPTLKEKMLAGRADLRAKRRARREAGLTSEADTDEETAATWEDRYINSGAVFAGAMRLKGTERAAMKLSNLVVRGEERRAAAFMARGDEVQLLLHKSKGMGLGMAGPRDAEDLAAAPGMFITEVKENGAADLAEGFAVGMRIIAVNEHPFGDKTLRKEAAAFVKALPDGEHVRFRLEKDFQAWRTHRQWEEGRAERAAEAEAAAEAAAEVAAAAAAAASGEASEEAVYEVPDGEEPAADPLEMPCVYEEPVRHLPEQPVDNEQPPELHRRRQPEPAVLADDELPCVYEEPTRSLPHDEGPPTLHPRRPPVRDDFADDELPADETYDYVVEDPPLPAEPLEDETYDVVVERHHVALPRGDSGFGLTIVGPPNIQGAANGHGTFIAGVVPGGPASGAAVRRGQRVLRVHGKAVTRATQEAVAALIEATPRDMPLRLELEYDLRGFATYAS